jgi:hypothetical protein
MNKKYFIIISSAILMLMLSACNLMQPSTPTVDSSIIYTQAALTVQAQFTEQSVTPDNGTPVPAITETPAAVTPTSGEQPGVPTATPTTQPSATSTTTTTGACEENVDFVRDISIPDNTVILPEDICKDLETPQRRHLHLGD